MAGYDQAVTVQKTVHVHESVLLWWRRVWQRRGRHLSLSRERLRESWYKKNLAEVNTGAWRDIRDELAIGE